MSSVSAITGAIANMAATLPVMTKSSAETAMRDANPMAQSDWDAVLAKTTHSSFFQGAAWARVLNGTYGFTPHYFYRQEASGFECLLPLMEANSPLTGRRGIALPFTDDCEPICRDAQTFDQLFRGVLDFGRARNWKYFELRGGRKWLPDAPASVSFYGHELDLTGGEERLFERVDSSVRRAIRKAEKSAVTVEVLNSETSVETFYSLLCLTRKRHGLPPQPWKFFQQIYEHVISSKLGRVVLANVRNRPIAGGMYFGLGANAIYKFGASDEAFQQHRGNNLVMWTAIKWHAQQGFKNLNLGRTSLSNEGLRKFKVGWGAVESRVEYVKYDLRKNAFVTDADEATGWHNKFFRNAPLGVSRLIGGILYKHWA